MKILVFGAGVLGCNLARNLFRAGRDVTLLARGSWASANARARTLLPTKTMVPAALARRMSKIASSWV